MQLSLQEIAAVQYLNSNNKFDPFVLRSVALEHGLGMDFVIKLTQLGFCSSAPLGNIRKVEESEEGHAYDWEHLWETRPSYWLIKHFILVTSMDCCWVDEEVGPMFRIRFSDGLEMDAFEDEITNV